MLCFVTKTTSLANSIRYALTHNDSSDYSAWAFAIVFTSAQHIGDENEAIECHGALLQSLEKIKKNSLEWCIASVTNDYYNKKN